MSKTKKNGSKSDEPIAGEKGRVIPFPQRNGSARPREARGGYSDPPPSPLRSEALGAGPTKRPEPDDYRHRMLVNAGAFALCTALVIAGVWMATTMADLRRGQDCVLAGRHNCGPVTVPARDRSAPVPIR